MESAAALRSFHCFLGTTSHLKSVIERPGMIPMKFNKQSVQGLMNSGKLVSSLKHAATPITCANTAETLVTAKSDDSCQTGSIEKNSLRRATFPSGFEALIAEVCDDTEVAELKIKIGDFEMHMKRKIGTTDVPAAVASPAREPPAPSPSVTESTPAEDPTTPADPSTSLPAVENVSPFVNEEKTKKAKLAALEASGLSGYSLVLSPSVGSFRRGKTLKGNKLPPICKEGSFIKEGKIIGFLDQFGTKLAVKSTVDGEVLKILYDEGEAVGFGDPILAVLPSFHDIK